MGPPLGRSTPLSTTTRRTSAAGLPDRAPKPWPEFAEWAPRLKAGSGAQYAYIYPALAGYAGWTLQNNLWGWGGSWSNEWTINCDSAEWVEALQSAQDSIYKDQWAGVSSKEAADDFAAGITSATIASTGSLLGVLSSHSSTWASASSRAARRRERQVSAPPAAPGSASPAVSARKSSSLPRHS